VKSAAVGSLQPPIRRIAVLRALRLGDLLCAVPALRALRGAFPHAHITLIALDWAKMMLDRFPHYLDGFIAFPGHPGMPEQPARVEEFPQFLQSVQRSKFDLLLQMQGGGAISNPLVDLMGARQTAGFFQPGGYCPDGNRHFPYPEQGHEINRLLSLIEYLGIPTAGEELEFPVFQRDLDEIARLARGSGLEDGEYVVLHPGASNEEKRWPVEKFIVLAQEFNRRGFRVVISGVASEAALCETIAGGAGSGVLTLAGRTGLGGLAALLEGARLLVCNDTGISHLAAALQTPSVVLFSKTEPERWAPLDGELHRVIFPAGQAGPDDVLSAAEIAVQDVLYR